MKSEKIVIVKDINLIDVLTSGNPTFDLIKKIGNKNVVINTLPINTDGRTKGAVALFKDAARIQRIEVRGGCLDFV